MYEHPDFVHIDDIEEYIMNEDEDTRSEMCIELFESLSCKERTEVLLYLMKKEKVME